MKTNDSAPATLSERFVDERLSRWLELRTILIKIRDDSYLSLDEAQVKEFARLYRLACADLAQARTLKLSPDVIEYINSLVGQAHNYLYSFSTIRWSLVKHFFWHILPSVVIKNRVFVLLSALFFFLPLAVTFFLCLAEPDTASLLVPGELLDKMSESYREQMFSQRGVIKSTYALTFYINNNITVAFLSFATGVLAGLGTIYFLVYNGLVLGAISGYIVGMGFGKNFLYFVTAHSVLELFGLVVAGGAGLMLGFAVIKATKLYKKDQLGIEKDSIFFLLAAAALLIGCAAAVEGGISPQPLHYGIKLTVAVVSLVLVVFYFGWLPVARRKKKPMED